MENSTKRCKTCGEVKELSRFYHHGEKYYRSSCKTCWDKAAQRTRTKNHRNYSTSAHVRADRRKLERAAGQNTDFWIYVDSRKSDRKAGRENDLTREFIREQITKGCSYCGETELRMTLDRIDNTKGHTKDNVVPACIRCNYTRKDMPYAAWLIVAKGMQEARAASLFGAWTGRIR
jgi:hypothetical protein